jgi:hypothetical protein
VEGKNAVCTDPTAVVDGLAVPISTMAVGTSFFVLTVAMGRGHKLLCVDGLLRYMICLKPIPMAQIQSRRHNF